MIMFLLFPTIYSESIGCCHQYGYGIFNEKCCHKYKPSTQNDCNFRMAFGSGFEFLNKSCDFYQT